jgi:glutathione peroxidase
MSAHDFEFTSLDGKPLKMSAFAGRPVLVVNTASECGATPQYAGLQSLWEKYRDTGLVVLGVPSNDFGGQEPGKEDQIAQFCETNYSVTFPMTSKNKVIGGEAHPFYKWVVDQAGEDAAPRWNFHKYLIGADGELAGVFGTKVTPESDELTSAVEAAIRA